METKIRPGLHIYYCGHEACAPGHGFGPAARQHYLIHFVLEGKGVYQVGDKQIPVEKGTAFLIYPHEITYYEADRQQPWEYIWIAFDGEEADRLLMKYRMDRQHYVCRFRDWEATAGYLRKVLTVFPDSAEFTEEILGYFYLIWSGMERPSSAAAGNGELDYLNQAKKYIRYNFSYPIRIEDMAHYIGIDRTYLYRIFIRYEGKSPKQYLTAWRVEAADEMLENTDMTITQVALSCGFHDSSSFCRQFKEIKGKSPRWFRKKAGKRRTADALHCRTAE